MGHAGTADVVLEGHSVLAASAAVRYKNLSHFDMPCMRSALSWCMHRGIKLICRGLWQHIQAYAPEHPHYPY